MMSITKYTTGFDYLVMASVLSILVFFWLQ